ncbi:MAG: hypothetical protein KYX63_00935 [Alteromonas macleodii]|nr:hypothetical protein [Alteromonas macleodii]
MRLIVSDYSAVPISIVSARTAFNFPLRSYKTYRGCKTAGNTFNTCFTSFISNINKAW